MKRKNHSSRIRTPFLFRALTRAPLVLVLVCALAITAFAYYSFASTALVEHAEAAVYSVEVFDHSGIPVEGEYVCPDAPDGLHTFTLTAAGTASTGYGTVTIDDAVYTTEQLAPGSTITLSVRAARDSVIRFGSSWGSCGEHDAADGDTIEHHPLAGRTISILGDSISTYTGWSDVDPITDESCRFRYGEAYYGPVGGDFHNTDMVVEDTWWHQSATALGADILMVNSGNSTGLLIASYPPNADWDQYLKEMLAYKSRPHYLGKDGRDPDIIALYIGSNEVARASVSQMGSIEQTDLDTLIVENEDGTYTYAEPQTVAEAYCIMMHKIRIDYPDAEVYCFAVVPNAGGYLSTVNKRLPPVCAFNDMVRGVADYYGAHVVDLMEAFRLDPDGDGVAVQEDFDRFHAFYHNDPHPNAAGFDVISECFTAAVLEHSKYAK